MSFDHYLDLLVAYEKYVLLGLMVLFFLCLVIFVLINMRMGKLIKYYRTMLNGTEGSNLEELIYNCSQKANQAGEQVEQLTSQLENIQKQIKACSQKVSIVRFNAFEDVGGEMSFALAVLNQEDTGFILSNIYARQESHVYIRPIEKGKTSFFLLQEEEMALEQAKRA